MCFDDSLLAGALASVDADDWVADLETRATWWMSNFPILLFVAVSNDTRCEIFWSIPGCCHPLVSHCFASHCIKEIPGHLQTASPHSISEN